MTNLTFARFLTVRTLIRAAFIALSVSSIGVAHSEQQQYHAPAHNFYQNNWMAGGG